MSESRKNTLHMTILNCNLLNEVHDHFVRKLVSYIGFGAFTRNILSLSLLTAHAQDNKIIDILPIAMLWRTLNNNHNIDNISQLCHCLFVII